MRRDVRRDRETGLVSQGTYGRSVVPGVCKSTEKNTIPREILYYEGGWLLILLIGSLISLGWITLHPLFVELHSFVKTACEAKAS